MKLILLTTLIILTGFAIPAPVLAGLEWSSRRIDHLASVADETAEVDFKFTNTGKHPVTITSVRTSCGCTTAKLDKKTYQPGESGEVTAIFAFGGRAGKQRKRITVYTSESGGDGKPITDETALELRVTIPEPIVVRPRLVYWRASEDIAPKKVRITINHDEPIHVTEAVTNNGLIVAELEEIEPGKVYDVTLTPDASEASGGMAEESDGAIAHTPGAEARTVITIKTDFPEDTPRNYTVLARVMGKVSTPAASGAGKPIVAADTSSQSETETADAQ